MSDAIDTTTVDSAKKDQILNAAMTKFSAYGFARTSMADIATEAGMSRPALYLHYANKEEIFRSMLERVLDRSTTAALAELQEARSVEQNLNGFLQRYSGDLMDQLLVTEHGADILEAKSGYAKDVSEANSKRIRLGLTSYLKSAGGSPDRGQVAAWTDLVLLSPLGFKYDQPPIAKFRKRLSALAASVAASVAAAVTATN